MPLTDAFDVAADTLRYSDAALCYVFFLRAYVSCRARAARCLCAHMFTRCYARCASHYARTRPLFRAPNIIRVYLYASMRYEPCLPLLFAGFDDIETPRRHDYFISHAFAAAATPCRVICAMIRAIRHYFIDMVFD